MARQYTPSPQLRSSAAAAASTDRPTNRPTAPSKTRRTAAGGLTELPGPLGQNSQICQSEPSLIVHNRKQASKLAPSLFPRPKQDPTPVRVRRRRRRRRGVPRRARVSQSKLFPRSCFPAYLEINFDCHRTQGDAEARGARTKARLHVSQRMKWIPTRPSPGRAWPSNLARNYPAAKLECGAMDAAQGNKLPVLLPTL